jgi:hypothetical protein
MAKIHIKNANYPWLKRKCKSKPHKDSTSLLLPQLSSKTPPTTNVGADVGKRNPHTLLVGM